MTAVYVSQKYLKNCWNYGELKWQLCQKWAKTFNITKKYSFINQNIKIQYFIVYLSRNLNSEV